MRRRTPGSIAVAEAQKRLLASLERLDLERAREALEPFITSARGEKLRSVFAARMDDVTVVMDAPHDPHNGAAVVRTCDAFGVQTVHVVERVENFLAAKSVARGSERWVDVRSYPAARDAIAHLRCAGYSLIATHPRGALSPADLVGRARTALVLGNERDGIADELRNACDETVRIPMRGFAESLNVSVTAAILIEHLTRGRRGDLSRERQLFLYVRALVLTVPHAAEVLAARGVPVPDTAGLVEH